MTLLFWVNVDSNRIIAAKVPCESSVQYWFSWRTNWMRSEAMLFLLMIVRYWSRPLQGPRATIRYTASTWCVVWRDCLQFIPLSGKTPCLASYSPCSIKPPSAERGSVTTKGRCISCYQSLNTRERKCDKVAMPNQHSRSCLSLLLVRFL
jgi:hypothetical protein